MYPIENLENIDEEKHENHILSLYTKNNHS